MNLILAIAAGGALGSLLRHFVSGRIMQHMGSEFPYGTLTVNIVGGVLLGLFVGIFARYFDGNNTLRAFATVGLLGGFTTFSAFSLDVIVLLERGDILPASVYVLSSVIGAVLGLWLGLSAMRILFA